MSGQRPATRVLCEGLWAHDGEDEYIARRSIPRVRKEVWRISIYTDRMSNDVETILTHKPHPIDVIDLLSTLGLGARITRIDVKEEPPYEQKLSVGQSSGSHAPRGSKTPHSRA